MSNFFPPLSPQRMGAQKMCLRAYSCLPPRARVPHLIRWLNLTLHRLCCSEPYFFDLGRIAPGDDPNGTTLTEMHDYRQHGNDSISAWESWLGLKSCKLSTLDHGLPPLTGSGTRFQPVISDVTAIYTTWLKWRIEAVRSVSKEFLLTVGFNNIFSMLPAVNALLDFQSHHVYPTEQRESSDGLKNYCLHNFSASKHYLTAFDRLRHSVASKPGPVTYGEFGSSTGDWFRSTLSQPNSKRSFLSFRTQALYDTAVFAYSFASGADGALHWRLNDHPLPFAISQSTYIGDDSLPAVHFKYLSEGRFGLVWYDGTASGRPKPLAMSMSFIGPYLSAHIDTYDQYHFMSHDSAVSPIHLEWNMSGPSFLALGASSADSPGLSFVSDDPDGVVLFANWSAAASTITMFAASDVRVRLSPTQLLPPVALPPKRAAVVGKHGGADVEGAALVIQLLQGEQVLVNRKSASVSAAQVVARLGPIDEGLKFRQ